MRGSAGREVGALLLALKMHRDDLAELPEQLSALGQKLKSECRAESELVNALRANLQHAAELTTKGANSSVTGTPRNISSSSSEVSDLQKRHSNSSSRNREAARSNPNAINSTIQGAAYGTPRTASQVKRQQWDSGTTIS
jgi:cell division septum initiation protein DivIVA